MVPRFASFLILSITCCASAAKPNGVSSLLKTKSEYRSSCRWDHGAALCVPTNAEIFAPGAPSMRTFNAKAFSAAMALEQQCGMSTGAGPRACSSPCRWIPSPAHSGGGHSSGSSGGYCHMDQGDALRLTLSCAGSEVRQQAACGFEGWDRLDWQDASADTTSALASSSSSSGFSSISRRLLVGGAGSQGGHQGAAVAPSCPSRTDCSPVSLSGSDASGGGRATCAAGFFAHMSTKEDRTRWSVASNQGVAMCEEITLSLHCVFIYLYISHLRTQQ